MSDEEVSQCVGQLVYLCLLYGAIVYIVSFSKNKLEKMKPNYLKSRLIVNSSI